jgi:hypothetical protein
LKVSARPLVFLMNGCELSRVKQNNKTGKIKMRIGLIL